MQVFLLDLFLEVKLLNQVIKLFKILVNIALLHRPQKGFFLWEEGGVPVNIPSNSLSVPVFSHSHQCRDIRFKSLVS